MKKAKNQFQNRLKYIGLFILSLIGFLFLASIPDASAHGAIFATAPVLFLAGVKLTGKSLEELRDLRGQAMQKLEDLVELAETEKRDLTDPEIETRNDLVNSLNKLKDEIRIQESIQEEKRAAAARSNKKDDGKSSEQRDLEKFSILRLIKSKAEGRQLDGLELEMHQEAEKEARASGISLTGVGIPVMVINEIARRAITATGTTTDAGDQGGQLIPSTIEGLVMALRPRLVLAGLGAQTFGNMVGNLTIVKGSSTSVGWEGENTDLDETDVDTSVITVSPKRLGALTKISKQWLLQTNRSFEQRVMDDIMLAIAQAVELAAIAGTGSGNNQPTGLLSTVGIGSVAGGTNGLAPAWSHITGLESIVDIANANNGSLAYLTNNKVKNKLKNTLVAAGYPEFIWPTNQNMINGYKAETSNLVPANLVKGTSGANCSAIVFGDFRGMEIYNWGGMDITVDPYTSKKSGQLEIAVDSFWDTAIRQPAMFAAMLDALTA